MPARSGYSPLKRMHCQTDSERGLYKGSKPHSPVQRVNARTRCHRERGAVERAHTSLADPGLSVRATSQFHHPLSLWCPPALPPALSICPSPRENAADLPLDGLRKRQGPAGFFSKRRRATRRRERRGALWQHLRGAGCGGRNFVPHIPVLVGNRIRPPGPATQPQPRRRAAGVRAYAQDLHAHTHAPHSSLGAYAASTHARGAVSRVLCARDGRGSGAARCGVPASRLTPAPRRAPRHRPHAGEGGRAWRRLPSAPPPAAPPGPRCASPCDAAGPQRGSAAD